MLFYFNVIFFQYILSLSFSYNIYLLVLIGILELYHSDYDWLNITLATIPSQRCWTNYFFRGAIVITALLGANNPSDSGGQSITVAQIIDHPGYDGKWLETPNNWFNLEKNNIPNHILTRRYKLLKNALLKYLEENVWRHTL